ncbi:MAG: NAD(P)-dependent oxidoreductase [Oscillospiraceae bacterium]|nr:NAD(P)-dependent oxidoreductase [Oscillospiraceae bacterium]
MKTAVITGCTGAIGVALCRRLTDEGMKVYAVCRENSRRISNIPEGVNKIYRDLRDIGGLGDDIASADVFFHLGWADTAGSGRNDMYSQTENIRCALEAVRAAHKMGCGCFIGAGSQAEYGRHNILLRSDTPCFPENGYGMAKLCAGQMTREMCKSFGIRHIWARILSVYGPYDGENSMISMVINSLLDGSSPRLTKGEQMWDYLYSDDAAKALYLMYKKGRDGAVYPLGSGEVRPLKEYIEKIHKIFGSNIPLKFGEVPYGERQVMHLGADISEIKSDVGFVPVYDFERGIKITVKYIKQRKERGF